jgi:anaerobic selenocysteine-containing dehydrogenase
MRRRPRTPAASVASSKSLAAPGGRKVEDFAGFVREVAKPEFGAAIVTGNYPSEWVTPSLVDALRKVAVVAIDTLPSAVTAMAEVVLPSVTWAEKAGTFENAKGRMQVFRAAIAGKEFAKSESQIAMELLADRQSKYPHGYDDAATRAAMAKIPGLEAIAHAHLPSTEHERVESDMVMVEL